MDQDAKTISFSTFEENTRESHKNKIKFIGLYNLYSHRKSIIFFWIRKLTKLESFEIILWRFERFGRR